MIFDKLLDTLELNKQEFYIQFSSHPNYPSALAFSETLNFMGVRNISYTLEKDFWDELPSEFITIYKNNFSLVKKKGNTYKVFSEKISVVTKFELLQESTNFISIFEILENKYQKRNNYSLLVCSILCMFIIYSYYSYSWFFTVYNIFSIVGVYLSLEIFKGKYSKSSPIIREICGDQSAGVNLDSCSKLINADKLNVFGLKLSDLCLIYFISLCILGVFPLQTEGMLKYFSLFSLGIICYSIITQLFIEKIFCKVCFIIITILLLQISLSLLYFGDIFSYENLFLSFLLFIIIATIVAFVNEKILENNELKTSNIKNLRFKKDYDIFKREIINNDRVVFQSKSSLFFGDINAPIHVSIISNPFCGYCKEAHEILEKLLNNYTGVALELRFNYSEDTATQELTNILNLFFSIYNELGENECLRAIKYWFENRDYEKLQNEYIKCNMENNIEHFIIIGDEHKRKNINFTPILFFNGYRFPDKYDRSDIFYFIEELIEDKDFL
ncbi:ABC transporter permease [Elizabethkingia anophelis]|nr:ABC transporter permease [Elizabethkingia anophelis]MDV3777471.1 ABC transporter permease [Elizabethkingia anophelis]MDV3838907.1 ABC transporter permease [Elizabethkingia anophelis]